MFKISTHDTRDGVDGPASAPGPCFSSWHASFGAGVLPTIKGPALSLGAAIPERKRPISSPPEFIEVELPAEPPDEIEVELPPEVIP